MAAVVAAGMVAALGLVIGPYLAAFFIISAAAVAVPLMMRDQPKLFARACLVVGVGLLAWAMIGAGIGMFLFIPAALLLLVAAFAAAGNRPGAWLAVTAPIVAATVVAVFYLQPPDPENEPPPWFNATLDFNTRVRDRDFNRDFHQRTERLRDFGATRVEVYERRTGQFVLTVGIPDAFAEGQSQDRLKEQILQLPEVVDLRFCTFHTCD
ncbi:hypothetical protein OG625_00965 [Streptomyces sp. NBC_01351]|uniref:hypothetical protein n=1 Tax=Streptomyces sp. NBC_01351 TaxID=2903833 RepID=UPI002E31C897|nr:hypothetical protein [Streptomyces sp. NBC_01351]